MNDYKKITILTATLNSEKTLEQTISSVVAQDYKDIEYIIIDGNSTDNTIKIIKKYERYGVKWISEPDDGLYDALNKGIEMATGDYFMVLGSDDSLYSKDSISKVVANLEPDTDVLSATVIVVDDKSKKCYKLYNHHASDNKKFFGEMIPHQGMIVKTSFGKKYQFDKKYKIAADFKFFLQCYYCDNIKFKFIDEPVTFYSSNGLSANEELRCVEYNSIYNELGLPFHAPADSRLWMRWLKKILFKFGILSTARKIYDFFRYKFIYKTHRCDNEICRWCGRV